VADYYRDVVARLRAGGFEFKRQGEILKDAGLPKAF
jgi:hypothetical protein